MYHRFRSKERSSTANSYHDLAGFGFAPLSADLPHKKGNDHIRKQTKSSNKALDSTAGYGALLEENFIGPEFRSSSFKKASRTHIKALVDKEMFKEIEVRRSSPSIVARLMGLDTLPPSVDHPYRLKERRRSCQKNPFVGSNEKHAAYDGYSLRTRTNNYHECKDVFEVTEKPKAEKHKNQPIPKARSTLKENEVDMAFIKQKFMDATYLSGYNYKELDDELEFQNSSDGKFLNFLQEPNRLFKMHVQELKRSPHSPHASDIAILKPSRGTEYESSELCCKSERYTRRRAHMQNGDLSSSRKAKIRLVDRSLKEHYQSLPCKLLDLQYNGKIKDLQPTQIIILKPGLEKVMSLKKTVPLETSRGNDQFCLRQPRNIPISRNNELYAEGREGQKLSNRVEVMGHKTTRLKKIAREINEQMRSTRTNSSKEMRTKIHGYLKDERSYGLSGMGNSELFQSNYDHLNYYVDELSTASYYSTESLLSREARKRLSERWKMTQTFQEERPTGRGSSKLGEMLASSDRKTPRTAPNKLLIQNISIAKVDRNEVVEGWNFPSGISSQDGWKDGCSRNLPRSRSHPASSLVYQDHKATTGIGFGGSDSSYLKHVINKRRADAADRELRWRRTSSLTDLKYRQNDAHVFSSKEEHQMSEREIHVNSEILRDRIHDVHPDDTISLVSEVYNSSLGGQGQARVSMVPELSDNYFAGRGQEPGDVLYPKFHKKSPLVDNWQHMVPACSAEDGEFLGHNWNSLVMKETSINHHQAEPFPSHCDALKSISPISSEGVDQPSHVTVLEHLSLEEDKSCPDSFEKISSDLHELRLQLKLLKLGTSDTYPEDVDEEENGGECLLRFGEILEAFKDDEDRDFSYLLDILTDSGVHDASQYAAVGSEVFGKLEKKYKMLTSWSRSERRLLFDLLSSVLTDIVSPLHKSAKPKGQPIWARADFLEQVWRKVVKQRKEPSAEVDGQLLDTRWLDGGGNVDMVGEDLERMIIEDLMEELY